MFVDNRYISPGHLDRPRRQAVPAAGPLLRRRGHQAVRGGAVPVAGRGLRRAAPPRRGLARPGPSRYDELEPYYTQAEQLYQVHGARGEDPTEPSASAPVPVPGGRRTSRASSSSPTTWPGPGYHPFHAPCGILLNEPNMAYSACVRCGTCDGFPCLVHAKADAEVLGVRPALTHPNVELLRHAEAVRLETNPSGTAVTDGRGRARGPPGAVRGPTSSWSSCGAANSAKLLLALGQRPPPGRPGQRLRRGRPQLHVPRQPGRAGPVPRAEPDRLPEDVGRQRLLPARPGLRLPDGQHPDDRQVAGRDVPRREAAGDQARPDLGPAATWPTTRSTSGCPRRTFRGRTTGSRSTRDGNVRLKYTPSNPTAAKRLYHQLKSMLGDLGMHPDHLMQPVRLHEDRHPAGRGGPPGRHLPVRQRPGHLGARRRLQGPRAGQPLRRGHELLPQHRGGQPGADRDGQRDAGRRPPAARGSASAHRRPPRPAGQDACMEHDRTVLRRGEGARTTSRPCAAISGTIRYRPRRQRQRATALADHG